MKKLRQTATISTITISIMVATASQAATESTPPATTGPLEQTAYFDLVLAATLPAPGDARAACFLLPDGSYVTAVKNQRLGTKHAYISRVNSNSIEVTELLPVNRGEWAVSRFFWPVTASVTVDPGQCPSAGTPLPSPEAATTAPQAAK
jgi:Tfp pilus assembly protein PilP